MKIKRRGSLLTGYHVTRRAKQKLKSEKVREKSTVKRLSNRNKFPAYFRLRMRAPKGTRSVVTSGSRIGHAQWYYYTTTTTTAKKKAGTGYACAEHTTGNNTSGDIWSGASDVTFGSSTTNTTLSVLIYYSASLHFFLRKNKST